MGDPRSAVEVLVRRVMRIIEEEVREKGFCWIRKRDILDMAKSLAPEFGVDPYGLHRRALGVLRIRLRGRYEFEFEGRSILVWRAQRPTRAR